MVWAISIILIAGARVHVTYLMTAFVPMCSGNSHHDEMENRPYLYHKLYTSYSMEGYETYNHVGYGSVPPRFLSQSRFPKVLKVIQVFPLDAFWGLNNPPVKIQGEINIWMNFHANFTKPVRRKIIQLNICLWPVNTIWSIGTRVETAFTKQILGFVDLNYWIHARNFRNPSLKSHYLDVEYDRCWTWLEIG